ncbi:MAG: hypothetical protein LBC75_11660 [Fibromonadaceae bacterium]|jgi:hypothetical protein|nr:hypothetical protein [Fibromonadaceae bacterium]
MLNFAAKHFRTFIEISLWLNLVFCATYGVIIGGTIGGYGNETQGKFLGFILGVVLGLLSNIIFGGLLAVFLSIDKGVKNINKWLQCIWENSNNINDDAKTKPINDDEIFYF